MYTVIFRRQRYSSDYSSSDGKTQFYSTIERDEAIKIIKNCVAKQLDLEHDYKTKYKQSTHPYGDYDFIVLYNGAIIYEGYDFDEDGIEDYTYNTYPEGYPWESDDVDIDVNHLKQLVRNTRHKRYEILTSFHATEQKIKTTNQSKDLVRHKELAERKQLADLLAKYPDMVKK